MNKDPEYSVKDDASVEVAQVYILSDQSNKTEKNSYKNTL